MNDISFIFIVGCLYVSIHLILEIYRTQKHKRHMASVIAHEPNKQIADMVRQLEKQLANGEIVSYTYPWIENGRIHYGVIRHE